MTTKEFIEKVSSSTDMQAEISRCTSPGEAYVYAQKEGVTDSMELFLDMMQKAREASSEMTAADVDSVTGGSGASDAISLVTITASPSVVFASASAAACGI